MPNVRAALRRLERLAAHNGAPIIFPLVPLIIVTFMASWFGVMTAAGTEAAQPGPALPPKEPDASTPLSPMQGDLGHPYYLPPASRARMHECALAWQRMKFAGGADDLTWRVFATGCLTAPDVKSAVAPDAHAPNVQK